MLKKIKLFFKSLNNNTYYILYVYQLASWCAICPLYDFKTKKYFKKTFQNIYSLGILTAILASYLNFIYGVFTFIYEYQTPKELIVDTTIYTVITILNSVSIMKLKSNFKNWKNLLRILKLIKKIKKLKLKRKNEMEKRYALLKLFFKMVLVVSIFSYESDIFVRVLTYALYKFHFFLRYQYCFVYVQVLLVYNFANAIEENLRKFNERLVYNYTQIPNEIKFSKSIRMEITQKNIFKSYHELCDLIEIYNVLFGWKIIMIMGILMLSLLEALNFIIGTGFDYLYDGELYNYEMCLLNIVITVMIFVSI